MTKKCTKCKVEKDVDDFYSNATGTLGRAAACKECTKAAARNKYDTDPIFRAKILERAQLPDVKARARELANTPKGKKQRSLYNTKVWYPKNKEALLIKRQDPAQKLLKQEYDKAWYSDVDNRNRKIEYRRVNAPIIKIKKRVYYINNKVAIRKYSTTPENKRRVRERKKDRLNGSIELRLRSNLRSRLGIGIRAFRCGRKVSAVRDLGCTVLELIKRIEFMFSEGMCWDNYGVGEGKGSIDHIRPLSSFKLSDMEQQKLAVHYTNLQPMWHIDNIRKGDKWNPASQTSALAALAAK